jgi:hypothetical protein
MTPQPAVGAPTATPQARPSLAVRIRTGIAKAWTYSWLFLAQMCAPKGFDVYHEREVQIQQNLALEIVRRILTSGHFNNPHHPVRYKSAKDIRLMAQLLYQHSDLVRGLPARHPQRVLNAQGRLGRSRP